MLHKNVYFLLVGSLVFDVDATVFLFLLLLLFCFCFMILLCESFLAGSKLWSKTLSRVDYMHEQWCILCALCVFRFAVFEIQTKLANSQQEKVNNFYTKLEWIPIALRCYREVTYNIQSCVPHNNRPPILLQSHIQHWITIQQAKSQPKVWRNCTQQCEWKINTSVGIKRGVT